VRRSDQSSDMYPIHPCDAELLPSTRVPDPHSSQTSGQLRALLGQFLSLVTRYVRCQLTTMNVGSRQIPVSGRSGDREPVLSAPAT
jgi:hypothetical protein